MSRRTGVIVLLMAGCFCHCAAPGHVDAPLPIAYVLDLDSGERASNKDFEGKPVVLDFWASWCSPCIAAFPHFQNVYDSYRANGVHFFAVNYGESPQVARRFLETNGYSIPLVIDSQLALSSQFKVVGIPTTYLLDKRGSIRFVHRGFLPDPGIEVVLQRELDVLLAE